MCSSKAATMHGQPFRTAKEPMQSLAVQNLFSLMVKRFDFSRFIIHALLLQERPQVLEELCFGK